jgi:hypothetical protein
MGKTKNPGWAFGLFADKVKPQASALKARGILRSF